MILVCGPLRAGGEPVSLPVRFIRTAARGWRLQSCKTSRWSIGAHFALAAASWKSRWRNATADSSRTRPASCESAMLKRSCVGRMFRLDDDLAFTRGSRRTSRSRGRHMGRANVGESERLRRRNQDDLHD